MYQPQAAAMFFLSSPSKSSTMHSYTILKLYCRATGKFSAKDHVVLFRKSDTRSVLPISTACSQPRPPGWIQGLARRLCCSDSCEEHGQGMCQSWKLSFATVNHYEPLSTTMTSQWLDILLSFRKGPVLPLSTWPVKCLVASSSSIQDQQLVGKDSMRDIFSRHKLHPFRMHPSC